MAEPVNKNLYSRVKSEAKKKFKVWPSAYASGWLVKEYKRRGGTYRMTKSKVKSRKARKARKSRKSPLSRWFQEKWINVCDLPKITPCGRKKSAPGKYPYCRPLYRVDAKTPRTVREVGRKVLKSRCRKKRSNPKRRVR